MDKHKNRELYDRVEALKAKRVIKKDAEIVAKTGFSKGLVSNYLSGRIKASANFMSKFDEVFGPYENKVSRETKSNEKSELPSKQTQDLINSFMKSKIIGSINDELEVVKADMRDVKAELRGCKEDIRDLKAQLAKSKAG